MCSPKVSVIIPIYNVGSYLSQCLSGLIRQTLTDIEILCIDDASQDDSVSIVKAFQEQDPRIHLLQQAHLGVSAARNAGILQAKGEYLVFIDGDDWVQEDMLEKMTEKAYALSADVVICSSLVHFSQPEDAHKRCYRYLQPSLTVREGLWHCDNTASAVWDLMGQPGVWPFIWNKLIRRELILKNRIFFSRSLPLGEDGVFLQLLFQCAKTVVFLPDALHHYRYLRKSSATQNLAQDKAIRFEKHIDVVSEMLREFHARQLLDKNKDQLLSWIQGFLYADFVSLEEAGRNRSAAALDTLFSQYSLTPVFETLPCVPQKRLKYMTKTKKCSELKRKYDILWTKVENRIQRMFCSNR